MLLSIDSPRHAGCVSTASPAACSRFATVAAEATGAVVCSSSLWASHVTPNTFSSGSGALSTLDNRSSVGIAANTSFRLLSHLHKRNPPLETNAVSSVAVYSAAELFTSEVARSST